MAGCTQSPKTSHMSSVHRSPSSTQPEPGSGTICQPVVGSQTSGQIMHGSAGEVGLGIGVPTQFPAGSHTSFSVHRSLSSQSAPLSTT